MRVYLIVQLYARIFIVMFTSTLLLLLLNRTVVCKLFPVPTACRPPPSTKQNKLTLNAFAIVKGDQQLSLLLVVVVLLVSQLLLLLSLVSFQQKTMVEELREAIQVKNFCETWRQATIVALLLQRELSN